MRDQCDDASDVQAAVTLVSAIGMAFVKIPMVIVVRRFTEESTERNFHSMLFLVAIGWPFALGFVTRWWPQGLRSRRWIWLLCFLGIPVPAFFLLGLGIFLVAAALVYPWAFWMTRTATDRHKA